MDISAVISKMIVLVILLVLGYVCARLKIITAESNKTLSKLVINVFLFGMIISSASGGEINMTGTELAYGISYMFLLFIICVAIGFFTPTVFRLKGDVSMYRLMTGFMNNGFIAFPIIQSVFGDGALLFASTSNLPFNILIYTYGVYQLQGKDANGKIDLKKMICPPLIATFIALIIFLFHIELPATLSDLMKTVGSATVPLSMMVVGASLGGISIKDAFTDTKMYLISFMRIIVAPLTVYFIMRGFVHDPVMLGTFVIIAAAPIAVICTVLGIEYGHDPVESSKGIFLSTVLSMITIPVLLIVLGF